MVTIAKTNTTLRQVVLLLLVITVIIVISNTYRLSKLTPASPGALTAKGSLGGSASQLIPTGIPEIYGNELGISFDGVSPQDPRMADLTIGVLAQIDRERTLEGTDLERYINALYVLDNGISCEYCCGARSIIFENGEAACGCAHSFAMRGLAKYLLQEHGSEYTDEEILSEVAKWKVLFFPGQMQQKADVMASQGLDVNYVSVGSNKYRGIEKGSGGAGGMVGGC